MNKLTGAIEQVESDGALSLVDVRCAGVLLSALVVETPAHCDYLKNNQPVELLFKETEVAIAVGRSGEISLRNRFSGAIKTLRFSGLLCEVVFDHDGTPVTSLITARSAKRLKLCVGMEAEWLIKANEISLRACDG